MFVGLGIFNFVLMSKKSIRFFNDREVRAVWDDENNCWWFSATDVVRAINDEPDYTKAGNYWRWLKRKLKQDGIQLVSPIHDFKFEAPDVNNAKLMYLPVMMSHLSSSIFQITKQLNSLIGLHTVRIQLTGKVVRRLTHYLKADF